MLLPNHNRAVTIELQNKTKSPSIAGGAFLIRAETLWNQNQLPTISFVVIIPLLETS